MKLKDEWDNIHTVERYWNDDTDPMSYKVYTNFNGYRDMYYSCDLVDLIEDGKFEVVD